MHEGARGSICGDDGPTPSSEKKLMKCAKIPYLAHQLSVFFWHRQVILVDALLVLDGNAGRHEDLYWFEPPERYNTLHPIRAARVSCTGL